MMITWCYGTYWGGEGCSTACFAILGILGHDWSICFTIRRHNWSIILCYCKWYTGCADRLIETCLTVLGVVGYNWSVIGGRCSCKWYTARAGWPSVVTTAATFMSWRWCTVNRHGISGILIERRWLYYMGIISRGGGGHYFLFFGRTRKYSSFSC